MKVNFENIFTHDDADSGLKAVGFENIDDKNLKKINADLVNKYDKQFSEMKEKMFTPLSEEEEYQIKHAPKENALQALKRHKLGELVPYYGSASAAWGDIKIHRNLDKLRKGEILSPEEFEATRKYVRNMQEEMLRSKTLGADFVDGFFATVPFLIEAGIGFATTPEGVGLASLGQTGSKFALRQGAKGFAKKEIRKALEKTAKKNFGKELATASVKSLYNVPKFTVTKTPFQLAKRFGEYWLDDDICVTERGQLILNEAESNPCKAFLRALGDTSIENFSETTGGLIGLAGKGLAGVINRNVLKRLPSKFAKGFEDITKKVTGLSLTKAFAKYGYHGIIEEMGEERAGDLIRYACGPLLDDDHKYTFEGLLDAAFGGHTLEGFARNAILEGLLFGVTGGAVAAGLHGTKKVVSSSLYKTTANDIREKSLNEDGTYNITKMKSLIKNANPNITDEALDKCVQAVQNGIKNVGNYSVDDFLLDSGVFRRNDRDSITDSRVRKVMEQNGAKPEDIENVLAFATPETKAELVKLENSVGYLIDEHTKNLRKKGMDEKHAKETSTLLISALEQLSKKTGISLEELYEKEAPEILKQDYSAAADEKNNLIRGGIAEYVSPQTNLLSDNVQQIELDFNKSAEQENIEIGNYDTETLSFKTLRNIHSQNLKTIFDEIDSIRNDKDKKIEQAKKDIEKAEGLFKIINETNLSVPKYEINKKKRRGSHRKRNAQIKRNYENTLASYNSARSKFLKLTGFDSEQIVHDYKKILDDFVKNKTLEIKQLEEDFKKAFDEKQAFINQLDYDYQSELKKLRFDEKQKKLQKNQQAKNNEEQKHSTSDKLFDENDEALKNVEYKIPKIHFQKSDPVEYFNNPEIAKAEEKLEKDIKAHLDGKMHEYARINFGKAPLILQDFGVPDKIMLMPQDKYDCSTGRKEVKGSIHHISDDVMKKLPSLLADPIMIAYPLSTASKQDNRLIVAVNEVDNKKDKNPVCVIIDYDWQGNKVNIIPSAYGREDFDDFVKACENENKIVYVDEKNLSSHVSRRTSLRVNSKGSNNSITYKKDKFNPNLNIHLQSTDEVDPNNQTIREGQQKLELPYNGKLSKVKGAYISTENFIELFKGADHSTIVHEIAHWYLERLQKYAERSEEIAEDLEAVRKFVKNTGGEFSYEEHERFAKGFEAYIMTGNAKNNKLKRIFDDLKSFFIELYDSITRLGFKEEDLPELYKVFDRIFTTENDRVQTKVFDKCNEIEEQIKKIKEKQKEELDELDRIWSSNIEINNRKSDKKRKVEEYLELAEKAASKLPKEVKEMQKRYKDATLDILSEATGYDKKFIANSRNLEKIELALDKADDKITVSGGMRPEWAEFYSDTGVNYDTDETDGDYKLARQAFDVLASGNYNFDNQNEDEIGKFYGQFEYLYGKVLSLKGEEKANALEAIYSLFEKIPAMPDEVTQDIMKKLSDVDSEYEESEKEAFNRKTYPSFSVVNQLQYFVTKKLKDLKVYDPSVRYKRGIGKSHSLYRLIKNVTSVNTAKKSVRKINEYVIADLETNAKAILHKEIQRQIKVNSRTIKTGSIQQGKFDWKTNTVFRELVKINRLKRADVQSIYEQLTSMNEAHKGEERNEVDLKAAENLDTENLIDSLLDPHIKKIEVGEEIVKHDTNNDAKTDNDTLLKIQFLKYRLDTAHGDKDFRKQKIQNLDYALARKVLEQILSLKFEGRRAKQKEDYEKARKREDLRTNLVGIIEKNKDNLVAKGLTKLVTGDLWLFSEGTLGNWESLLNAVFDKKTAPDYSLLKLEADTEVYAHQKAKEFIDRIKKIYGFDKLPENFGQKTIHFWNKMLDYDMTQSVVELFRELDKQKAVFKQNTYNKETGEMKVTSIELSKSQMITIYGWSLNSALAQRLNNQFGPAEFKRMSDMLSEKEKEIAWAMIDTCDSMYDDLNEVFIDTTGLNLERVENYIPSATERIGSDIDMLHENMQRSTNPSCIKARKFCSRIKMKPKSPLEIMFPHINKVARYVVMSETLNKYKKIFESSTLQATLTEVYGNKSGDKIHRAILNQLASSTFANYARSISIGRNLMDAVASNYISSRIGGNAKVLFGQLTSVINYAENMPAGEWAKRLPVTLSHPEETIKFMFDNCPYLKARLAGNSMNEVMTKLTSEADRFRSLRNFCATNTKYGDIAAIVFGGKGYVDYLMEQGATKEEAFTKFVEATLRAQQSGHNSATSLWQKKQADNPIARMVFAFNNTNLQYERKFIDAISAVSKGDITKKEFLKAVFIYKIMNPIMFTSLLGNLSFMTILRMLFGDDDPEKAMKNFGGDMALSVLMSNLGAYGWLGIIANSIIQAGVAIKNGDRFFTKGLPVLEDVNKILLKFSKKSGLDFADWVDVVATASDDLTGVPTKRLSNATYGVYDMTQGEYGVGAFRVMGWGEYKSYEAFGKQKPKKRKK